MQRKDNRYALNSSVDQFNFKTLSESSPDIKKFAKALKTAGADPAQVVVGKLSRKDGTPTKPVTFHMDSGQRLILVVGNDGAVIQVKLNSKIVPSRVLGDHKALAKQLGKEVKDNEKAFLKRQAAALKTVKVRQPNSKRGSTSIKRMMEELQESLEQVELNTQALQGQWAQVQARLDSARSQLNEKVGALDSLKNQEKELKAEIKQLEAQQ